MFGDKLLFGQTTTHVDSKSRIFMPAKTKREKGDVVYLVHDRNIYEYKIVPKSVIEAEYRRYKDLINSAKTVEELTEYKRMLTNFSNAILRESTVDAQGRITLGDDFIVWEEVILIGGGNHLILRPKISDEKKKK